MKSVMPVGVHGYRLDHSILERWRVTPERFDSCAGAAPAGGVLELGWLELGALRLPLSHECGVKRCVGFAASEAAKRSEQSEWLFDRLVAGETP
jgi:hypothetical protein